jgi:methyltransferase-like protein 6
MSCLFYFPSLFGGFRRWVQAVFCVSDGSYSSSSKEAEANHLDSDNNIGPATDQNNCDSLTDSVIDMSEGVAADMFGVLPCDEYEVRLSPLLRFC